MSKYNGLRKNKTKFEKHRNNNCYTYAINQPVNPYTGEPYEDYKYCQPGILGGKGEFNYAGCNSEKAIEFANRDLQKIGYEIIPSTLEEYIDEIDCWKVAFCYCDTDYHWYRQNLDGTWSHKLGTEKVKYTDEDDKIIYNPKTCNRGKYKNFVGFFIIRKRTESNSKLVAC